MQNTDTYLDKFKLYEQETRQPSWLLPWRKAGLARFSAAGFPTINDEDWRFTNVTPIAKLPFKPAFNATSEALDPGVIEKLSFGRLPATRLVFVNGIFAPRLSSSAPAQRGLIVTNLAAALSSQEELTREHLAGRDGADEDSFGAINTAYFRDGAFIVTPKGAQVELPVHLVFLASGDETGASAHPRNIIVAGENSRLTVLETYASLGKSAYLTNSVTDLVAGQGAVVEHCKVQQEGIEAFHIAALRAHLDRGCNVVSHSFATGAKLSRNNIRTHLSGEGVECILNGLYLTRGEQLADHHMVVEHAQPHCNSHEYFNGILDDRSRGVFHGRILVRPGAQKTDAKQTNKNLLLSEDATVDTKPQLEIYADDVKCTHGATIGQLNDDSIFYLRARGIGSETARRMLVHAFAGEIIERIRHAPAREELDQAVWDRLEAHPQIQSAT
jgi:Fe-S cluster assembly protein SufD